MDAQAHVPFNSFSRLSRLNEPPPIFPYIWRQCLRMLPSFRTAYTLIIQDVLFMAALGYVGVLA